MTRLRQWVKANWGFVALTVVLAGAATALALVEPDLAEAQRARTKSELRDVTTGAWLDYVYMVAYAAWGWAAFSLIRRPSSKTERHPAATAGGVLVVAGAVADAVENVFLLIALSEENSANLDVYLGAMRAFGLVKWGLLISALVTLAALLLSRPWRPREVAGLPTTRPGGADWDPPRDGTEHKTGIALSGGGIRSAAFCLGALQALRARGPLARARYITAVSGGGYLAAGWAVSDAAEPRPDGPPAWDPGSPEERWFRDHASYLVPDTKGGFAGLFRLLAGVFVNLALLGLLLVTVSRPVGWAIHSMHEKLRAADPTVLVRDNAVEMQIEAPQPLGTVSAGAKTRYSLTLAPADEVKDADEACFDLWPYQPKDRDACVRVGQGGDAAGVVEVAAGRITIVKQPKVKVLRPTVTLSPCDDHCHDVRRAKENAFIQVQPAVSVVDDLVVDGQAPVAGQFQIDRQPRVSVKTGLGAMTWPVYRSWMWELVIGLWVAALAVAAALMAFRLRRYEDVARALANALAGTALAVSLVVIVLPWVVVWLPRTLGSLTTGGTTSASGSGWADYLAPSGGLFALVLVAVRQFMAGSEGKNTSGTGASLPWPRRMWNALTKRSQELKWYESSPSKVAVAVLAVVGATVAFVNALQFAVGNGWDGRLMGFGVVRDQLPYWLFFPDWAKFAAAAVALALFAWFADAHAWSLYPFYKQRLSLGFIVQRDADGTRAAPIPYGQPVPYSTMQQPDPGPQLVACCAVNLGEYGVVPPGRRAASFTFSSTEIGGPLVGYAPTAAYEALPIGRFRDVTVPSGMAISGAAFSPAMGKFNLGPVGGLLALANLRLGVWIPHPRRVVDRGPSEWQWWWFRRPHWVWFLRELTNKYAFNRRYVYVSDGGHWDNLGLVELLRRGCTEIYCISGAGDGALSFSTIGEALALAREELGVSFELDPSPLRPAVKAPDPEPTDRVLRREGAKDKASPFAAAAAVVGTFEFTRDPGAKRGVIYYVEADLTESMPFDVHAFAEAETVFPDDSTGDQVFNHRQFESYRALGYYQATEAAKLPEPPTPTPTPAPDLPPGGAATG